MKNPEFDSPNSLISLTVHNLNTGYTNLINNKNSKLRSFKMRELELDQLWYVCPYDDFKAKNKSVLKSHMVNKHDVGKNEKLFLKKQKVVEALSHSWYTCSRGGCSKVNFKKKEDLVYHLANEHRRIVGLYQCPYCTLTSEKRSLVWEHVWDTHMKKIIVLWEKYKCPSCGFRTDKLDDLPSHIDTSH